MQLVRYIYVGNAQNSAITRQPSIYIVDWNHFTYVYDAWKKINIKFRRKF